MAFLTPISPQSAQAPQQGTNIFLTPIGPQPQQQAPVPVQQAMPKTPETVHQDTMDTIGGFNEQLAHSLGTNIDTLDSLYRKVTGNGSIYGQDGAWGAMKRAAQAIGLNLEGADNFYGHLGSNLFNSLLGTATLLAGQPGAAAQNAAAPIARIGLSSSPIMKAIQSGADTAYGVISTLGKQIMERPYLSAATEIGGAAGQARGYTRAKEHGGDETTAQLTGLAESVLGAALTGTPFNMARSSVGGLIPKLGGGDVTMEQQGLATPRLNANGERIRTPILSRSTYTNEPALQTAEPDMSVVGQAVAASKQEVQNGINKAVAKFKVGPQGPDPDSAAENMQAFLRGPAFKRGRDIESGYWRNVNLRGTMDGQDLRGYLRQLIRNEPRTTLDKTVPGRWITKINQLGKYKIGENPDGTPMYGYKPFVARELMAIRAQMDHEMREGITEKGGPMSPEMRRNYKLISDQILAEVGNQNPAGLDKNAWAKARDFSTWFNDQFTRGPLARFMQPYSQEANLPNAAPGAEGLMRQPRAGRQLAEIRQNLKAPGSKAPDASVNKLVQTYVNNTIAEIANGPGGPAAAARYIQQPRVQKFMKNFPKVAQGFKDASDSLLTALNDEKAFKSSKFLNMADEAPEVAAHRLFNAPDAAVQGRQIMQRISKDPDAVQAFKDSLIANLAQTADPDNVRLSPSVALHRMGQQNIRGLLDAVFSSKELDRLNRIFQAGASLEHPSFSSRNSGLRGPALAGRIIGAKVGRIVDHLFGGGTIQVPGILSRAGQAFFQNVFNVFPPGVLVAKAAKDPRWEAFLMSKAPETATELHAATKQFRALAATISPLSAGMADRWNDLQDGMDNGQ